MDDRHRRSIVAFIQAVIQEDMYANTNTPRRFALANVSGGTEGARVRWCVSIVAAGRVRWQAGGQKHPSAVVVLITAASAQPSQPNRAAI